MRNRIQRNPILAHLCRLLRLGYDSQPQATPLQTRIDGTAAFFIAHLVSSVMYHADRDKGKCDLHGGRRQVLIAQ